MKGYMITDGYHELAVCAETRERATGTFIRRFAWRGIRWKELRTQRAADLDGPTPWEFDSGAFSTVEYWGRPVQLT